MGFTPSRAPEACFGQGDTGPVVIITDWYRTPARRAVRLTRFRARHWAAVIEDR